MKSAPHLLDATMFWNASGGVRRYITAKRDWAMRHVHWRHTVATPMPDGGDSGSLRVPSLPLPGSNGAYRLPWQRRASAALIRDARPDLIEAADAYRLGWAALDAARELQVPAVAFCHSNLEQLAGMAAGRAGRALARRYAARFYRRFDLVMAPSLAMVGHLHDWGVSGAVRQPLGVDTSIFNPAACNPGLWDMLCLPAGARLLVYSGRFAPEKNLQTLVDATSALGDRYWLLAIGSGPAPPRGKHVVAMPAIRQPSVLAGAIAACDLFVHAGSQETFGLSALEALACGVPVVARAAEGLSELVDSRVGRGVESGGVKDFAEAIEDAFAGDRAEMSRSARERALAYDWNRVLPKLWDHYLPLMSAAQQASGLPRTHP